MNNIDDTPTGSLPGVSSATFSGYLRSDISGPDIEATFILGEAVSNANLDGIRASDPDTITGSASRFYDGFEEPLSGSLAISGSADPADNVITGRLAGTLSQEGTDFSVSEALSGAFKRPDGSAMLLTSSGDILVEGADAGDFNAEIVAER